MYTYIHICTVCGAVARLVCIDRSCVRYEGRVAICLTANLQRSGEWDQTGGKITPHTPKWETIIPPKVTQTQPRIKIIAQAQQVFCSPLPLPLLLHPSPLHRGHRENRTRDLSSFRLFQFPRQHFYHIVLVSTTSENNWLLNPSGHKSEFQVIKLSMYVYIYIYI